MTEINDIRNRFFDKGKNITTIARETGYDRKTVRKYIFRDDWNKELADESRPSKLDPFKPLIDSWLENDKHQRRKQRHTARRVFNRLSDEVDGFDASYRTVSTYVGEARRRLYQERRGFLPLQHIPGEAQVDFGEADFIENGHRVQVSYLTLSLPYSNGGRSVSSAPAVVSQPRLRAGRRLPRHRNPCCPAPGEVAVRFLRKGFAGLCKKCLFVAERRSGLGALFAERLRRPGF